MLASVSFMASTPSKRRHTAIIGSVVAFCVAVLVLAWVSYGQYEQAYRAQTQARLQAIAEMKATEVESWRRERLADAQFYVNNVAVIALFEQLQRRPGDATTRAALVDLIGRMQQNHAYERIALHDASGVEWVAAPAGARADDGYMVEEARLTAADGQVRFLDVHSHADLAPHLVITAPLRTRPVAGAGAPGAVVLRLDARLALTPFLTSWPVPSPTAETLLARREGNDVVILNTIIGVGQPGDLARIPLTQTHVPTVRAVLGETDLVETVNRHGVPVVAALVPIAGSPWFMVAATAQSELYGPLRERAGVTIAMVALLLVAGVAGLGFVWRGQARRVADSERALIDTLKSMAEVVEASPVVLFQWRAEPGWPVEWVSANVARWGYTAEALTEGRPAFSELIHVDDVAQVHQEVARFTADGADAFVQEYRIHTADGRVLWIDDRTTVVRGTDGGVVRYEGTLADITERKQLQAQFVQAQKMETVGRLAGGVAHDFNNLLTVINGYAEFALSEMPDGDPLREMVQEIYDAGQRASGLTRQLLTFSRRQVVQLVSLNINVVAEQMQRMLARLIGEDVRLTFDLDPGVWPVKADAGQLDQVIMNLAVNARDAMPGGGTLVVTTRNIEGENPSDGMVLLSVADTGCGMDEATQQRLFEPFFTTKQPGQGTGLGLATVYGIVTQAGGRIEVSSAVGLGTTFRVYLPRLDGESKSVAKVRPDGIVRGTERVLIVEDEESLRRIAQRILTAAGYTTLCAANGDEAITILDAVDAPVDLLLTDVVMPGMSGHELAARLNVTHPNLKVLFASGYLPDAFPDRGRLGSDVQFLAKPYSPSSLTAKVRDVLDRT